MWLFICLCGRLSYILQKKRIFLLVAIVCSENHLHFVAIVIVIVVVRVFTAVTEKKMEGGKNITRMVFLLKKFLKRIYISPHFFCYYSTIVALHWQLCCKNFFKTFLSTWGIRKMCHL